MEILKTLPLKMEGLDVCVIGHSEIVGKPIAFLMMGLGATVTVCHHMTRQVAVHSRAADAVFVAVGSKDPVVTPQPAMGQLLLSYHRGPGELWLRPMDHSFNAFVDATTLDEMIGATAGFFQRNLR